MTSSFIYFMNKPTDTNHKYRYEFDATSTVSVCVVDDFIPHFAIYFYFFTIRSSLHLEVTCLMVVFLTVVYFVPCLCLMFIHIKIRREKSFWCTLYPMQLRICSNNWILFFTYSRLISSESVLIYFYFSCFALPKKNRLFNKWIKKFN